MTGHHQTTPTPCAQGRAWAATWARAGVELERLRRAELGALLVGAAAAMNALFAAARAVHNGSALGRNHTA